MKTEQQVAGHPQETPGWFPGILVGALGRVPDKRARQRKGEETVGLWEEGKSGGHPERRERRPGSLRALLESLPLCRKGTEEGRRRREHVTGGCSHRAGRKRAPG